MQAFHGSQAIKDKHLERVRAHRAHDDFIRGTYWTGKRGCGVGCTIELGHDAHRQYEVALGIPKEIAYLEDSLFESMTWEKALDFPEKFLENIGVGTDLSKVVDYFILHLLLDEKFGLNSIASKETKEIIAILSRLIGLVLQGSPPPREEWVNLYHICSASKNVILIPDESPNRTYAYTDRAVLKISEFYTYHDIDILGFTLYAGIAHSSTVNYSNPLETWMDHMADKLIELLASASIVNMLTF